MSIETKPPAVTRTTTVANISTTERFPVERADNGSPPPPTRPPATPKMMTVPAALLKGPTGVSKAPTQLRADLEARLRHPGPMRHAARPVHTGGVNDPPEGIGRGDVPPGGVKVL